MAITAGEHASMQTLTVDKNFLRDLFCFISEWGGNWIFSEKKVAKAFKT